MQGLYSMWIADLHKVRQKLAEMKLLIDKLQIADPLKASLITSVQIVEKLLNKGRVKGGHKS